MSSTSRGKEREAMDFYRTPDWAVRAALPVIGEPRSILDLGCGDGAIGAELRRAFPHAEIVGVELDPARAKAARELIVAVPDGPSERHVPVYNEVLELDVLTLRPGWFQSLLLRTRERERIEARHAFDVVIANPPYLMTEEFANVAIAATRAGGRTLFILPIDWCSSQEREEWHRANVCDLNVLTRRPSFGKFLRPCKGKGGCGGSGRTLADKGLPSEHVVDCKKCKGTGELTSSNDSKQYAWFTWGLGLGGRWSLLKCEPAKRGGTKRGAKR